MNQISVNDYSSCKMLTLGECRYRAHTKSPLGQWSPTFLVPETSFMEDNFSMGQKVGGGERRWFGDDSNTLHLSCTLFLLLLLYPLHLRSSCIRSQRLGTPALGYYFFNLYKSVIISK